MTSVAKIVRILEEEDFIQLKTLLENSRAQKFSELLIHYRSGKPDLDLHEKLHVSKNAFNVLKSRLYNKLQSYLLSTEVAPSDNLFLHAINIPDIIYKMDREIAVAILEAMEKAFTDLDLPEYLAVVYAAQKKLFFNTDKFYYYSKLYNKSIAFQLALNKAEEELYRYKQVLCNYYYSANSKLISSLEISLKEIAQIKRLNDSPRFKLFFNSIQAAHAIHFPELMDDNNIIVDKLLKETEELIKDLPGNVFTAYHTKAINSLLFVYYCRQSLFHHASEYSSLAIGNTKELINYSNIISPSVILNEQITYAVMKSETPAVFEIELSDMDNNDHENTLPHVSLMKYNILAFMIRGEYDAAYQYSKALYNSFSFKGIPVFEIEVKILHLLLSVLLEKELNAETIITGVSRKIKELGVKNDDRDFIYHSLKLLKVLESRKGNNEQEKIEALLSSIKRTDPYFFRGAHKLFYHKPLIKHIIDKYAS